MSLTDLFPNSFCLRGRALRAASISTLGLVVVLVLGCQFLSPSDGQAGGPDDPGGNGGSPFNGQAGGPSDPGGIVASPVDGLAGSLDRPTVVIHEEGPDDSQGGAPVFQSNWSTALGTSDNAQGDGGRWDRFFCNSRQIMEVVPGAGHGWTLTPNVLQMTNQGPEHCRNVENSSAIPETANDYYVRLYIRLENVGSNGATGHSVSINTIQPIQGSFWKIGTPVANTSYRPAVGLAERVGLATWGYEGPSLSQNAWYRFEFHVQFYDPANPLRFRIWPFIYNMAGTLVGDASSYVTSVWPNTATLATDYAAGGYGIATSRHYARILQVGYEGSANNNDIGGRWYYAGVEVRTDRFPGPIQ